MQAAANCVPRPGPELAQGQTVAILSVRLSNGKRLVTVRGRLTARDLRRLERACGPALEQREVPLELRLSDHGNMDEAAQVFLAGLIRRGAVLS